MKKHLEIYEQFDVVAVMFPFSDSAQVKLRPALVLSADTAFNLGSGCYVLAMITTAEHSAWPLDCNILHLEPAGLSVPCLIRMKLFTLDAALISKKLGHLSRIDCMAVRKNLRQLLAA